MVCVVMMTWLAILGAQAIAGDDPLQQPVATTLRPPRPSFMEDLHVHIRDELAGKTASPLFRPATAAMEVHWRLAAYDVSSPLLTEQQQQETVSLARIGVVLGLQSTLHDLIAQSPELAAIHRSLRTFTSPSVEISARNAHSTPQIRLNTAPGARAAVVEQARFDEGSSRPLPPRLRLASGLTFVDLQAPIPHTPEPGVETPLLQPGLTVTLEADRLGPLSLRSRASLVQTPPQPQDRNPDLTLDWLTTARSTLGVPQLSAIGSVGGDQTAPMRRSVGLEWRPSATDIPMQVALIGSQRVFDGEARIMLQYSQRIRWNIPNDVERWPLGQEPDAPGPLPLVFPDRGPPTLVILSPPVAETVPALAEGLSTGGS